MGPWPVVLVWTAGRASAAGGGDLLDVPGRRSGGTWVAALDGSRGDLALV